MMTAFLFHYPF